jgi:hypothetical protein
MPYSKTITPCPNIYFDVGQIRQDIDWLFKSLNFDLFKDSFNYEGVFKLGVNLTHPPMEGQALEMTKGEWPDDPVASKYLGPLTLGDKPAAIAGLDTSTFNITGAEIADRYLGTVIEQVKQHHANAYPNLNPVTRVYLAYLNTFSGYKMHIDQHTHFKYHLPIIENDYSYMFSENDSGLEMTHLPADGRLWRLNTRKLHSAINMAPQINNYRMHIIFSVYDDPFDIYESERYTQP